jgi:hypothetical protein
VSGFVQELVAAFRAHFSDWATWRGIGLDLAIGAVITTIGLVIARRQRLGKRRETAAKLQALATSALLTEVNGEEHASLTGGKGRKQAGRTLAEFWGVTSRDELLKTLAWLRDEGHLAEYLRLRVGEPVSGADSHRAAWARAHPASEADLLAWDLTRLVSVARWGFAAALITRVEAWAHILPAAERLLAAFPSWRALGEAQLRGRGYWRERGEADAPFRSALERLCDPANQKSPWRRAWH